MPERRLIFILTICLACTVPALAAGSTHMNLTWDFYNEFDRAVSNSPGESFMRYHLITFGHTFPNEQDVTLLYDWFDWTEGENNTHALTPWAILYTKELSGSGHERRIQAGYWLVTDIIDQHLVAKESRLSYTVARDLAPGTKVEFSVGAKAPASGELAPTAGANLRRRLGKAELIAGVNNISTLDDILLSAGRIPISVGARYQLRDGVTVHIDMIYMSGSEPRKMISKWVRSKTNLVGRFGFDFAML